MSACSSTARQRCRINAPRGRARDRRPSYLIAWTMARSAPSYVPTAAARATNGGRLRQRGHVESGRLMTRHDGSGSPQRSQSGGVSGRIERQQIPQTGPWVGCWRSSPHAAHDGARTTESRASAAASSTDDDVVQALRPAGYADGCTTYWRRVQAPHY